MPLQPGARGKKKAAFGRKKKKNFVSTKRKNHYKAKHAMRVRMISTQFGRGLAAVTSFKRMEVITCYAGRRIATKENLGTKAGRTRALASSGGTVDWTYLIQLSNGEYREGGQVTDISKGRLGSLINDPHGRVDKLGRPLKPNCDYFESEKDGEVYVRALRSIAPGEEFLASYRWTPRTWARLKVIQDEDKDSLSKTLFSN
jgi:hypothetical protein